MDKLYITTSIAYTNGHPHIGFALELIQADVFARYNRLKGKDVYFLTGTDEHGLKIQKKAEEENISEIDYVNKISKEYQDLLEKLNISNDDFIRTTNKERHQKTAKLLWEKIVEAGDIYKKTYSGFYCVGCEAFLTEKDLDEDWNCPIHQKEPEEIEEENYFFNLSKYQNQLIDLISEDKVKIIPETRKNEILSFLKEDLTDISISRVKDKLSWGIVVPNDENQVMYVWVDALSNYLSGLDYQENSDNFKKYWPADYHFIGKDILRFHSVIWLGLLLAAGLKLPKNIFVHGFITSEGKKISKSLGNIIDPNKYIKNFGTDALRYYLLSEIPTTEDGDFTEDKFINRYNSDLANGLGNLLARTLSLSNKLNIKFDKEKNPSGEIKAKAKRTKDKSDKFLEELKFKKSLDSVWDLIHFADRYIEEKKPWKEGWEQEKTVYDMLYICYFLHQLLEPFLPETAQKIKEQLESGEKDNLFNKDFSK